MLEQALILIPVLYTLGLMLKQSNIKDWLIPWILLFFETIGVIALMEFNINAVIQGILVTGVIVYANQRIK
ncbi:phage holin family protein [uncultured Clostridium sp.]|uniref:phage holin family protein n=1 Tax=uncultured Clostridium sp. TaxID=59620 RepID=UPI0028EB80BF|nr:phage holin family protein [uncultured Clostridium sp.]